MIVTMRQGIRPLCTEHSIPMTLRQFGDPAAFRVMAFKCDEAGCTCAYNSISGYFDFVNDQIQRLNKEQNDCHQDETHMFLERIEGESEIWRCAQIGCDHTENLQHQPRY